jgi:hypothetical protein
MSAHERVWNPRQGSPDPRSRDGLVDLRADCGEADGDAVSRVAARRLGGRRGFSNRDCERWRRADNRVRSKTPLRALPATSLAIARGDVDDEYVGRERERQGMMMGRVLMNVPVLVTNHSRREVGSLGQTWC